MRRTLGTDQWSKKWGDDFDSEWTHDKRVLISLGILVMSIAFFCLICAFNLYSNLLDKADLSSLLIFISILLACIFAWVALREYYRIKENEVELGGENNLWNSQLIEVLFWLLIVTIIVTFALCILGIIKVDFLLPLSGAILLIIGIIGIIIAASFVK